MIPQGYKQTEIGIIPEDWNIDTISSVIISVATGGNYKNSTQATDYPLIKMGNISRSYINLNKLEYIIDCIPEENDKLQYGDVLLNTRNTPELVGKVAVWKNELPVAYFNSNLLRFNFNKEKANSFFMNLILNTQQVITEFKNIAKGTTSVAAIYPKDMLKVLIKIPNLPEQEKIAEVLSDTDDLISSLEKLIEKKKAIKQGAMQNLLTGKTRLPGFTNKWEEISLNELFDFAKGTGLSKEKLNPDGRNKCILYGELFTRYKEIIEDIVNCTDENIGVISKAFDVLMPCSTTTNGIDLATASVIMKNGILLGGDIAILRPKNKMDSRIFGYLMRLKAKEIVQYTQGSTIVHLNIKSFAKMKINITLDYEEQKAIAEILSDMDKEIEQLEQKLAKAHLIKQGMMQQLLTGKIRIV
jgi:type I restriction enzyme S subunit